MADYRRTKEPTTAHCDGAPIYIRADDILLVDPSETASGLVRFKHAGKTCTMPPEEFLNATESIEAGDKYVAVFYEYKAAIQLTEGGWIAGVMNTSGTWLEKVDAPNPEAGKEAAVEMLKQLANIEARPKLTWKYKAGTALEQKGE